MSKQPHEASHPPFFMFTNPSFPFRSWDISAPIICPRGVDQYSFLNPKPHGGGLLESQASPLLDVDPSAVSRSEIITITTGLTVSELAGGAFWKTTTVVETSDSPANSEEVNQQKLDDTVTKKFEHTQTTVCDVPNATCNSKNAPKHSKNMQNLSASSSNETEPQPHVEINPTLDQNKLLVKSLVMVQPVAEKTVTQVPNPTSMSSASAQSANNKRKPHGELQIHDSWCEICKVRVQKANFNGHILGKKHLKKLKASEKEPIPTSIMPLEKPKPTNGEVVNPNDIAAFRCEPCGVSCSGKLDFNKHLSGKKHQKKSKELLERSPTPAAATPTECLNKAVVQHLEGGKRMADRPADDVLGKRQKSTANEGKYNARLSCELCNVICTSVEAFTTHLASHEHSAMVRKRVNI